MRGLKLLAYDMGFRACLLAPERLLCMQHQHCPGVRSAAGLLCSHGHCILSSHAELRRLCVAQPHSGLVKRSAGLGCMLPRHLQHCKQALWVRRGV